MRDTPRIHPCRLSGGIHAANGRLSKPPAAALAFRRDLAVGITGGLKGSIPAQHHLAGLACFHQVETLLEVIDMQLVS